MHPLAFLKFVVVKLYPTFSLPRSSFDFCFVYPHVYIIQLIEDHAEELADIVIKGDIDKHKPIFFHCVLSMFVGVLLTSCSTFIMLCLCFVLFFQTSQCLLVCVFRKW
jgi:hypothetical protein